MPREVVMIQEIIVPKLGTNIEEGVIAEWRKGEGDEVKKGEVLLLVETSKAVFEVESEFAGYLRKIFALEGAEVRLTEPVAILTERLSEDINGYLSEASKRDLFFREKRHHEKKRDELVTGSAAPEEPLALNDAPAGRFRATPAARRLMAEHNIAPSKMAEAPVAGVVDESFVRRLIPKKKIAVYGGGMGLKQVRELLRFCDGLSVAGIIDDNPDVKGKELLGMKVLGGWDDFVSLASQSRIDSVVVSLHSEHRRKVIERIRKEAPHIELIALIDKRALVSGGVTVSPGVFIEAGAVIGPDTFIGDGAIVDTGAVVSHDCHIGAHSHLSPGCAISGIVRLEGNVLVGVGACVNSQVTIGKNTVITPGSAVVCDLPADVVVTGNPARIIGKSLRGM